ncbi:alanine dehydrogenase [Gemmatimonadota bacterium]
MIVGVPGEIKADENRVGIVPAGVQALTAKGHTVVIQDGAGRGSGISNDMYEAAGARILPDAEAVYGESEMIMKVKEPLEAEYGLIKKGMMIFTYFHFAADETLTRAMMGTGAACVAYETVRLPNHSLPLLTPMSEVAGRMATQEGAKYLEKFFGGRGVLLAGIPGVRPGNVVVIGGGTVGTSAARIAAGMGSDVTILDINLDRLRYLDDVMAANVRTVASTPWALREAIAQADLIIGAVLIEGAKAPKLINRAMLGDMQEAAVIVDVAVDQGGCCETTHPTTHHDPVYEVDGILHYAVANMPGAVPRTSTYGLTNATLPYAMMLADEGLDSLRHHEPLLHGLNVHEGMVTHPGVAEAFDLEFTPPEKALG